MQTFLHVGCGQKRKDQTTSGFAKGDWKEVRFDIDESVKPDYVGTMTDMSAVETSSMDALFSSHNIEHLYAHEVPKALAEFKRVLRPDGFVVITCPDIQAICALVAQDKLTDQAYPSPAGPITPHDILYGHGTSLAEGHLFMAHRCGFTQKVLAKVLEASGFVSLATAKRPSPDFDLWAVGCLGKTSEESLRGLIKDHFPFSKPSGEPASTSSLKNKRESLQKSTKELVGLYNAGRFNEALALGEMLSAQFSKDPSIFNILGAINTSLGKIENAINNYKKAINLKPTFSEAHNNLALSLKKLARNEEAMVSFKKAIQLNPKSYSIHYNLGNTHKALGQHEEAVVSFNRAIQLNPEDASVHNNAGTSLNALSRTEEAIDSFERAIKLKPDFDSAHINLGNTLEEIGKYHEAIKHYDSANTPFTKYKALKCFFKQKRYEEFNQRIINLAKSNSDDVGVAAISAYVSHQLNQEDPYAFCRNPLDFLSISNLAHQFADMDEFIDKVLEETANATQIWEPKSKTTHFGFQTEPTIFQAGDNCAELEKMIINEIESYYSRFKSEECSFINSWPQKINLEGWFVRLIKNGHQKSHMHPSGWLSGVVYLKTVDPLDGDEGSIELSLHGEDLPILNENYPKKIHQPKKGDIILFPSSLFHRTIPFNTDTERCVIAFDLHRRLP